MGTLSFNTTVTVPDETNLPRLVFPPGLHRLDGHNEGYFAAPAVKTLCRRTWVVDDFFVRTNDRTDYIYRVKEDVKTNVNGVYFRIQFVNLGIDCRYQMCIYKSLKFPSQPHQTSLLAFDHGGSLLNFRFCRQGT